MRTIISTIAIMLLSIGVCLADDVVIGKYGRGSVEYDNGTCVTAKTINPNMGNRQKVTLTNAQTCALTFIQPSNNTFSILVKVIQSSAGSYNGAISGGLWPSGVTPNITQTAGAVDLISCYLDGTNAYCIPSQDFK